MHNKKAFSLIEVIIATGIITISVFGIYKLIGENNKLINYSNNKLQQNSLFKITENCLKNSAITGTKYLELGDNLNECSYNNNQVFTIIDNIEYEIKIIELSSEYSINIFSETNGKIDFIIKK